ncbi:S ribonuclease [Pyrus ussuriensis x Pyrus communis]|uniref:S ribonuclease n=1 Tax=Pyrus ussuriensis x Pyrus communis TaxID=2448454 RepID=A0A5N5IDE6_9ROSA|nr:S ribonuclease [Pyrus ussuriensis x Pyrus communis]
MTHMHTNRFPIIISLIGLSDAIKLFLSSSLYEQHDRDTYQRSLSSMEIISIDMAFVTMKNMILLLGIYLTRS